MGKYDAAVRRAFRLHSEAGARPIRSLRIYGEYFGGWYPAPGVAARGAGAGQKVQAHAPAYAPEHDFFAFEVHDYHSHHQSRFFFATSLLHGS